MDAKIYQYLFYYEMKHSVYVRKHPMFNGNIIISHNLPYRLYIDKGHFCINQKRKGTKKYLIFI